MKKKIISLVFIIFSIFTLTGCSQSLHEELQEKDWIVNQNNGQSGEATFGENNISMSSGAMSISYEYSLNEDETEITMVDNSNNQTETQIYKVEKNKNEIIFEPKETSDEEDDEISTMTLIPKKEE